MALSEANVAGARWKLINEPEDRRPVIFVAGFFVYQLLVFSRVRSPWVAFLLVATPHFILQHAGLPAEGHFAASRTYISQAYNWLAFNVGYHAAHHYRPGVHWSRLPQLHASIEGVIPARLMIHAIPWFSSSYTGNPRLPEENPKTHDSPASEVLQCFSEAIPLARSSPYGQQGEGG